MRPSSPQGGLVTPRPTYRTDVSLPEVGRIPVICPIFGRGSCLTRTSERVASQGGLPGTPFLGTWVNKGKRRPELRSPGHRAYLYIPLDAHLLYELGLQFGRSSRLGVSPAPHLTFRIFTSFKGFFFLLRHPALCLFSPSTGIFLLFCAQLAHLFLGGVVLGRVGAHRRWPPSHALATSTVSW